MQQADLIQHSKISTLQVAILNLAQTEFTMKERKLLILCIYFCPKVAIFFIGIDVLM